MIDFLEPKSQPRFRVKEANELEREAVCMTPTHTHHRKVRGLQGEERLVLQEIRAAGNKGIWTRDLRFHTALDTKTITKILKTLEQKRLVKAVTSIMVGIHVCALYIAVMLTPHRA